MAIRKQRKRVQIGAAVLAAAALAAMAAGCNNDTPSSQRQSLSVCMGSEPESLDPIYAVGAADQTILNHLYENLMRKTGAGVVNGVVQSTECTKSVDGSDTWIFHLADRHWSDGVPVTASDFVYAWQRLADPNRASPYAPLLSIVAGYGDVLETGEPEHLQVSARDEETFEVVLNGSYDWFLTEVCTATATVPLREDILSPWEEPVEAEDSEDTSDTSSTSGSSQTEKSAEAAAWWQDAAHLITNGPYTADAYQEGESLHISAQAGSQNEEAVPQEITFRFAATPEEAQTLYRENAVEFLGTLPQAELERRTQQGKLQEELNTYVVLVNCERTGLAHSEVRQALSLAVDREAAARAAGVCAKPAEGLIPFGTVFSDTGEQPDFRDAAGPVLENDPESYPERCVQAVNLLSASEFDLQTLGELEYLYLSGDAGGQATAEALAEMWFEQLKITVIPRAVTESELQSALLSGEYDLAGVNLRPAAADPEFCLMLWRSDFQSNVCRYSSSAFDTLGLITSNASNDDVRLGCLHDAESLLLNDAPVLPLFTTQTSWNSRDTNFYRDPRGWFWFRTISREPS